MRRKYDNNIKAAAYSALDRGTSASVVAATLGVPLGTVKSWRVRIGSAFILRYRREQDAIPANRRAIHREALEANAYWDMAHASVADIERMIAIQTVARKIAGR